MPRDLAKKKLAQKKYMAKRYMARKLAGICLDCDNRATVDSALCFTHLQCKRIRDKIRMQRLRKARRS